MEANENIISEMCVDLRNQDILRIKGKIIEACRGEVVSLIYVAMVEAENEIRSDRENSVFD